MKKTLLLLSITLCFCSIGMAQNAHLYLKDGVKETLDLSTVDSITYLKPEAEIILPTSCTIEAGTNAKLTYMVSDGVENEPVVWGSTDGRIAYFSEGNLYAKKAGKCIVHATYKGVTSNCIVTVTPSTKMGLQTVISYAPLACYATAEIGVYMSQALTTGGKSQTGSYPYSQGWEFLGSPVSYWNWHCNDMIPAALLLIDYAEAYAYKNVALIGRTIRLMATMLATDIYGDMPRAELGHTISPMFETQQDIYGWMFEEADNLIQLYYNNDWINCPTNLQISATMDPIYHGDLQKWKGFCKALRARLWLRKLPNWDNTPAVCQEIIRLVDDALANFEEPRYYYPGGAKELNCPWGPYAPINGKIKANRLSTSIPTTFFLRGILGGIDGKYQVSRGYALDPRAAKIMEPRNQVEGMLHLKSNIGMDFNNTISNFPDLLTQASLTNPWVSNTSYIPLITTEELLFIKAEAQYWAGDHAGAYATTKAATKYNMERYGIEETTLIDHALNQYNRFFEIKFKATDFTLADLMQQKYVAMYLQPEQWTDMRRYNYSSSKNGIAYAVPGHQAPVYVYDVKNVHNGANALFAKDAANFKLTITLDRPYNLYEAYWDTPDDYGVNAKLSPNAWVQRINADQTPFNTPELERMGYYTTNSNGEKVLDHNILRKHLIWAQKNTNVVQCADDNIPWL